MRPFAFLLVSAVLVVGGCQSVTPPMPEPEAVAPEVAEPIRTMRVSASALNVRSEASMDGEILTQVKRGEPLQVLESGESWTRVQLPDGRSGWAASRFLEEEGRKAGASPRRRGSCLPDSDFAFASPPMPTFSDSDSRGDVVVEAHVDARGNVKSTKVVTNSTGDEALAFLTEREIRSATFIAPVRNCAAREFIYTYKRTF